MHSTTSWRLLHSFLLCFAMLSCWTIVKQRFAQPETGMSGGNDGSIVHRCCQGEKLGGPVLKFGKLVRKRQRL